MTSTDTAWREHARALAAELAAAGDLNDRAWRAAVEDTPRHVFVPTFYEQRADGGWDMFSDSSAAWLAAVYRNDPLITDLADVDDGQRVTVSSSTKPGLMVRMLEALRIREGHNVLEVGTGTGYNAALLSHRLGERHVFSVDIGSGLVDTARERLARLGYHPTLAAWDGAAGMPGHAPFDRIIVSCAVARVPWAWAQQLTEDGLLLVDLKPTTHAGNLALLRNYGDRLGGRFLSKWAGFMPIRQHDSAPASTSSGTFPDSTAAVSATALDPLPWSHLVPWFLAQCHLPEGLVFGFEGFGERGPEWATLTTTDGSSCAVSMQADDRGYREVHQSGPVRLWDAFERTYREWEQLGSPGWNRLGLTVWHDGTHHVWLDRPDRHSWTLVAPDRTDGRPS